MNPLLYQLSYAAVMPFNNSNLIHVGKPARSGRLNDVSRLAL